MSAAKQEARALKIAINDAISQLPKADRAAVHVVAQKIRAAIAEGDAQEDGIGTLALALIGAELQEQQA